MANITAAAVKRLREVTGSGMMAVKKALEDAEGDFDKAVELLRIKGAKDVGKRAERTTGEGLVASKGGVIIELDSETDFVAKNDDFIGLADRIVTKAGEARPENLEALLALDLDGITVAEAVSQASAKLGEKLELSKYAKLDGQTVVYLHKKAADLPPAVGVLVQYTGDGDAAAQAARDAAMQVAALKAKYVSRDEVPADVVANERRIAEETAKEEGKPEAALPKIVEGRVNGYYKDVVLLEQSSVMESKKSVKDLLDAAGTTVTAFVRFEVGTAN